MKIGIMSDTHDQIKRIEKAIKFFNQEQVNLVIHCGDLVAPLTLKFYGDLKCPIKFLFGNNTGDIFLHFDFAKKYQLKDFEFRTFYALDLDGKKIAVYHGDNKEITDALIKCGDYDCVFSGHDHLARVQSFGKVLFVNPGSLLDSHKDGMGLPSIAIYTHMKSFCKTS